MQINLQLQQEGPLQFNLINTVEDQQPIFPIRLNYNKIKKLIAPLRPKLIIKDYVPYSRITFRRLITIKEGANKIPKVVDIIWSAEYGIKYYFYDDVAQINEALTFINENVFELMNLERRFMLFASKQLKSPERENKKAREALPKLDLDILRVIREFTYTP